MLDRTRVKRGAFDYLLKPPPPEPPRRREPQNVNVRIEIVQQTKPPERRRAFSPLFLWATAIVFIMYVLNVAHGQTVIDRYRQGSTTLFHGTSDGRTVTGRAYKQGFTTYTDTIVGDTSIHCASYPVGATTRLECH
jgi:hypothetical protein